MIKLREFIQKEYFFIRFKSTYAFKRNEITLLCKKISQVEQNKEMIVIGKFNDLKLFEFGSELSRLP